MTATIEVRSVRKSFGATRVLDGVSLDVTTGEVAVLLGPSGCGKSTLLRCINGLEPFDAGSVRVGEVSLGANAHPRRDAALLNRLRRSVGMVFQALHLFPHLDVLGNLTEAPVRVLGEERGAAEMRARAMLDRVGLRGLERRSPRDISGGQQQRVAIARALLMKPEALLFDEPTSALDPRAAADVLAVMTELARGGQTMVVVTHGLSFARRAATTVHVLAEGHIVESGPPDRVFQAPEHAATRAHLSSSPLAEGGEPGS
jgi:ABC-type polar amino acid transport system ATPase subunit